MDMDPLDREIDGAPHFYSVPTEWLPHLGRLAVVSARIEQIARDLAEQLDLPVPANGRTNPLAQQCRAIAKRLREPWLPDSLSTGLPRGWVDVAIDWAEKTPDVVDATRNLYLHGEYAHVSGPDGTLRAVMVDRNTGGLDVNLDEATLREAIERLVPVDKYGFRIFWMLYRHRNPLPEGDWWPFVAVGEDAGDVDEPELVDGPTDSGS